MTSYEAYGTLESPIRAIPTQSFLFMPPDSCIDNTSRLSSRPSTPIMRVTSAATFSLA